MSKCYFLIFSKIGCGNCSKAKEMLDNKNINYIYIDCKKSNGDMIIFEDDQKRLNSMMGEKKIDTWPKIFEINNNIKVFIGGKTELETHLKTKFK